VSLSLELCAHHVVVEPTIAAACSQAQGESRGILTGGMAQADTCCGPLLCVTTKFGFAGLIGPASLSCSCHHHKHTYNLPHGVTGLKPSDASCRQQHHSTSHIHPNRHTHMLLLLFPHIPAAAVLGSAT
jgi:hypothetical protein